MELVCVRAVLVGRAQYDRPVVGCKTQKLFDTLGWILKAPAHNALNGNPHAGAHAQKHQSWGDHDPDHYTYMNAWMRFSSESYMREY